MTTISDDHLAGLVAGLVVAAAGLHTLRQNRPRIEEWLRLRGLLPPAPPEPAARARDLSRMSLAELLAEKERLEALIAEREMAGD